MRHGRAGKPGAGRNGKRGQGREWVMSKKFAGLGLRVVAFHALAVATISAAPAQTVGLGTTQGGATGQIATAISAVVSKHGGGLQMRPQAVANTSQYIPLINDGKLEFGIANLPQTVHAFKGIGMSEGKPGSNLRMVATLFPFNAGLMVTKASGARTYADLKGKRVPRYPANSLGDYIIRASLAAGGLTYNDVTSVPTANFPRQFEAFKAGQIDCTIAAIGSQPTFDFEASISGGVRFLTLAMAQEPILVKELPGAYLRTVPKSSKPLPGVEEGVIVFAYDYTLFAHKDVADEVVLKVVKALFEQPGELKATSPLWEEYDPKRLAKRIDLDWHPGARKYFEEKGVFGKK
jgi:hypothetical protein